MRQKTNYGPPDTMNNASASPSFHRCAALAILAILTTSASADQPGANPATEPPPAVTATTAPSPPDANAPLAESFPVASLVFDLNPDNHFHRAILERINALRLTLTQRNTPRGIIYAHPSAPGDPIELAPFAQPLNARITRGALLAIDDAVRDILINEFALNDIPSLGISPAGRRFSEGRVPTISALPDESTTIPADLQRASGDRARWIWTLFRQDDPDRSDDIEIEVTRTALQNAAPPAWGPELFDISRINTSLNALPETEDLTAAIQQLTVEFDKVGPDANPLLVYPGTAGRSAERVLIQPFAPDAPPATYTTSAFVAIDAAVRALVEARTGYAATAIAPSISAIEGTALWTLPDLPAGVTGGTGGAALLNAAEPAAAERTWTIFSTDGRPRERSIGRPLQLDIVGNAAHPLIDGDPQTQRYLVQNVEFVYPDLGRGIHPNLPPISDAIANLQIPLQYVESPAPGYIAARPGAEPQLIPATQLQFDPPAHLYASATRAIAVGVQAAYAANYDWVGHFVQVDPNQIATDRALLREGQLNGNLRVWIQSIEVDEVRTVARAENERIPSDGDFVNNPIHQDIIDRSPIKPRQIRFGQATEEETVGEPEVLPGSIPRFREIEEYAARLNRHPGRRIDPVVTPGAAPGLVGIDYLVSEVKPWLVLAEASNTGTEETDEWRYRVGLLHTQLTNADDILQLDYLTAGFDESHAVLVSYQRPIIADRLWARAYGNWSEYTASDVGVAGIQFEGESYQIGGELILNVFQHRDWFVDVLAGARYESVEVENGAVGATGEEDYTVAYLGARLERNSPLSSTFASIRYGGSISDIDEDEAQLLGRAEPDDSWTTFNYEASHSFFLEPILNPQGFNVQGGNEDQMTLAHELALSVRGQISLGDRLIPNEQQVAGGFFSVRGYPESLLPGDTLHILSAEYRYYLVRSLPAVRLGADDIAQPFGNFRFRRTTPYGAADWDLLFRAFIDHAIVQVEDPTPFELEDELTGVGVGVELLLRNNLSLRVDWGFALNDIETTTEDVDSGDSRVHFSATVRF